MADTCPKCGAEFLGHGEKCVGREPYDQWECCSYRWTEREDHIIESAQCLRRQLTQAKADSAKWEQMYLEEWKAGEDARAENAKLKKENGEWRQESEMLRKVHDQDEAMIAWSEGKRKDLKELGKQICEAAGLRTDMFRVEMIQAFAKLKQANATAKADAFTAALNVARAVPVRGISESDEIFGQQEMKGAILEELRRLAEQAEQETP